MLPEVLPEEVVKEEVGCRVDADEEVARVDNHFDLQDGNLRLKKGSFIECTQLLMKYVEPWRKSYERYFSL